MPLTFEQFKTLRAKGLSTQQIVSFEAGNKPASMQTAQPQEQPKKSLLENVGDFLGVGGLAKGITASILTHTDKEYKRILTKINSGQNPTEGEMAYVKSIANTIPTNKEVIGSALQTGATIATAGIGAGKILPTMAKVGAGGVVAGFGKGLEENKSINDSVKQSVVSGLVSAGTYGALAGAGKVVNKILLKAPETLMTDAIKVNKRLIESGKNPAKLLVAEKQFGGKNPFQKLGQLYADTENAKLNLGEAIAEEVKKVKTNVSTTEILKESVRNVRSTSGNLYSNEQIKSALKSAPLNTLMNNKEISFSVLNDIRTELGNKIGQGGFKKETPSLVQDLTREVWKSVRNKVGSVSPNAGEYITKLGKYQEASKVISGAIAQAEKIGVLTWADIVAGGLGATSGGVPGALGLYSLKKLFQSPNAKITAAQAINTFNEAINKIPTDQAGKISKTALINIFKGL